MSSSYSFAAMVFGQLASDAASFGTYPLYVSLHNGDPGVSGANELSNATYARVSTGTFWEISTATSVTTHRSVITFATDGNGQTVTYAGLWQGSLSTSTFVCGGALGSSFAYNNGTTPVFAAGALRLRAT